MNTPNLEETYGSMSPRARARAAGEKIYYGAPCKKGHSGLRRTASGNCVHCHRMFRWKPSAPSSARMIAKENDKIFYKGRPCKWGHSGRRYVLNTKCVYCQRMKGSEKYVVGRARKLAKQRNERQYQGRPCKYGHPGLRATADGSCILCTRQHQFFNKDYRRWLYYKTINDPIKGPRFKAKDAERKKRYLIRNALRIEEKKKHARAVNRNTISLVYYGR